MPKSRRRGGSRNSGYAVAAVAGAAAVGLAVVLLRAHGQQPSGSVTISPSSLSARPGQVITFTGTVKTLQGQPVINAPFSLFVGSSAVAGANTDASGGYSIGYAFPTAGSFSCDVAVPSIGAQSNSVTISVVAVVLNSIILTATSPTTIALGQSVTFVVSTTDVSGVPLGSIVGKMAEGGVAVSGPGWTTDAVTGVALPSLSFASLGVFSVTAISGSVSSAPVIVTVAAPPPTLKSLALVPNGPTVLAVGGSAQFTITAVDQNGAPLAGVSGQIMENGVALAGSNWTTAGAPGTATVTLRYLATGTFAEAAQSGSVASAAVTVTVTVSGNPVVVTNPPHVAGDFIFVTVHNTAATPQTVQLRYSITFQSPGGARSASGGSGNYTMRPGEINPNLAADLHAWVGLGAFTGTSWLVDATGAIISTIYNVSGTV